MEITEVRIKLMEDSEDRLRAFCSITFDHCFVIRDLKIIEGTSGPFVAMPSRKLTGRCNRCGCKNHLRSNYCNQCGTKLRGSGEPRESEGAPNKLYADIAHPIKQVCRDMIQEAVVLEYVQELQRAKLPGYVSRYDDDYIEIAPESVVPPATSSPPAPHFLEGSKPDSADKAAGLKDAKGDFGAGILDDAS
ncbi:MAG: SpoVG family protein [Pirellulales bacterium]